MRLPPLELIADVVKHSLCSHVSYFFSLLCEICPYRERRRRVSQRMHATNIYSCRTRRIIARIGSTALRIRIRSRGDVQMTQTWLFSVIVTKSPDPVYYTVRVALHPSQLALRLGTL